MTEGGHPESVGGVCEDEMDSLLDEALAEFSAQSHSNEREGLPAASSDALHDSSSGLQTHSDPPEPTAKVSPSSNQPFDPLPSRAKDKRQRHLGTARPQATPGKLNTSASPGDNLGRLFTGLDIDEAKGNSSIKDGISETLKEMGRQSAKFQEAGNDQRERAVSSEMLSEPLFAGLQEHFGEADGGFRGMADTLMRQLLAKDVLYQPMKDIGERYPGWLDAHRGSLKAEEVRSYEEQYQHIQTILKIYETNPENFGELFVALQEMQACGQPPQDIVNELAPGMTFDDDENLPQMFPMGSSNPNCCLQ